MPLIFFCSARIYRVLCVQSYALMLYKLSANIPGDRDTTRIQGSTREISFCYLCAFCPVALHDYDYILLKNRKGVLFEKSQQKENTSHTYVCICQTCHGIR